jgi:signal transduction histidine kinase
LRLSYSSGLSSSVKWAYENGLAFFGVRNSWPVIARNGHPLKQKNPFTSSELAEKVDSGLASRNRRLEILHKFALSQAGLNTLDEIVWNIAKTAIAELDFEDCVVYLLGEDGKTLVQVAAHGKKNPVATEILNPITIELGSGVVGAAAATGTFQLVSDTRKNTQYIVDDEIRLSELAVPIKYEGRVIGVLDSEHREENFYTDEHVQLFTAIASLASIRIDTAMAVVRLQATVERLQAAETQMNEIRKEQDRERKEATAQMIQASKLATLGEMATAVAHELNQPLNIIRLAAGSSRRKVSRGTADPQYLTDKLSRIEDATTRAAAIIDHMRMFGRKAKEAPKLIDPREVVTNALDLMGEQLRLDGVEIVSELAEDCPPVMGHAIQMEQVLLNLLTNARDAMAERDEESKITLRIFADDQGVHITSEDTGGGIPEDALPRIFEPFYTTKEMGKGTGLGLSVGYGIVRDMDGTITAENIGDGARFTITLPLVS